MNSLRKKLIVSFGAFIIAVVIVLSSFTFIMSKKAVGDTAMNIIPEVTRQAAESISNKIQVDLNNMESIARQIAEYDDNDIDGLSDLLYEIAVREDYSSIGIGLLDKSLISVDGLAGTLPSRPLYDKAYEGTSAVGEPQVLENIDGVSMLFAVPIKSEETNEVKGVLAIRKSADNILTMPETIKLLNTGNATIYDENGTIIADNDRSLVTSQANMRELAKEDPKLKSVAEAISIMLEKKKGITEYNYNDEDKYIVYDTIPRTDWIISIAVSEEDVYSSIYFMEIVVLVIVAITIIVSVIFSILFANTITNPIKSLVEIIKQIGSGDFTAEIDKKLLQRKDELGSIAVSLNELENSISTMVMEIKNTGESIANKSKELRDFSEELSSSSNNINCSISEIAEGNAKQSQDINDISEETDNFSIQINMLSDHITVVKNNTIKIEKNTESSKEIVDNMEESVVKFDREFLSFNKEIKILGEDMSTVTSITSMINDISEQTELLALNAAIEAARAGEAGKGFAVVADEIRILAEQSKNNADEITKIIDKSYANSQSIVNKSEFITKELEVQNKNINEVKKVVNNIADSIGEVLPKIENVYEEIGAVKQSQESILGNIGNVSAVSEEVSASSEEILAASNELSESSKESEELSRILESEVNSIINKLDKFKVNEF